MQGNILWRRRETNFNQSNYWHLCTIEFSLKFLLSWNSFLIIKNECEKMAWEKCKLPHEWALNGILTEGGEEKFSESKAINNVTRAMKCWF